MKLKIISVVDYLPEQKKVSKAGYPYSIFACKINAEIEGRKIQTIIKTKSKKIALLFKAGIELEVELQKYFDQTTGQEFVSYYVYQEKNESLIGGGYEKKSFYQRPKITEDQYFAFVKKSYEEAKLLNPANPDALFGFILGTGCNNINFETTAGNVKQVFADEKEIPFG
jgi:hypothetical protein